MEFQVLLLRYLFPERKDLRIVPVLCSSLPQVLTGEPPQANAEAEEFLAAMGEVLAQREEGAVLIAGVDLSHLGRRFGQELNLADRRNVCGVPGIYSLLRLLPPASARLLCYGQAPDPETQSVVTFMSAAFYC